jgi:RNA polymerase sigma factor (sigma-70 family)
MSKQDDILRCAFQYQHLLESYAYIYLKDWSLSKDAVQEAFISASKKWESLDTDMLLPWLKTVTKRRAIDIIRKNDKMIPRENLVNLVEHHFDQFLNEENAEYDSLRMKHLEKCLQKLNPKFLNVFQRYYHDHLNTAELGKEMKRSGNSIRILLHRIREKLRKCVSRAMELSK